MAGSPAASCEPASSTSRGRIRPTACAAGGSGPQQSDSAPTARWHGDGSRLGIHATFSLTASSDFPMAASIVRRAAAKPLPRRRRFRIWVLPLTSNPSSHCQSHAKSTKTLANGAVINDGQETLTLPGSAVKLQPYLNTPFWNVLRPVGSLHPLTTNRKSNFCLAPVPAVVNSAASTSFLLMRSSLQDARPGW